jgi:alcohol dehydrogenase class IV
VNPATAGDHLADYLAELIRKAGLATRLSDCGVPGSSLVELAASAAEQWTGRFNPRTVGSAELLALYEAAF